MALATDEKSLGLTKRSSAESNSPVDVSDGGSPMKSRTSSIYNSNVPLNQQMFSAVQVNDVKDGPSEIYEGGNMVINVTETVNTDRNIETDRGFISQRDSIGAFVTRRGSQN